MTSTILVREAVPSDAGAIEVIFAEGMEGTIRGGLRAVIAAPPFCGSFTKPFAWSAAHGEMYLLRASRSFKALVLVLLLTALDVSYGVLGTVALIFASHELMWWVVPPTIASNYVSESIESDYLGGKSLRKCLELNGVGRKIWVAVERETGRVVGTVALDCSTMAQPGEASGVVGGEKGWRWPAGTAELRRMSVAASARGRGVARE